MKKSVAVVGNGFVGGSLTTTFSERGFDVLVYDKSGALAPGGIKATCLGSPDEARDFRYRNCDSVEELVVCCERRTWNGVEPLGLPHGETETAKFAGVYFVCVPTPMRPDGSCDLSIVESVLDSLARVPGERIAVVKSTVPPGSTERWNKKYVNTPLKVVFNPEFLREASALDDMRNQDRIILGGPRPYINRVKQVFQAAFPNVPIVKTSSTTAECVKYVTNCFLATKVSFANEVAQIVEALDGVGLNVDFDKVVEYAKLDPRLGNSHWAVPGPDGHKGFGGSCFCKDLNAMMCIARQLGIDPKVMQATWDKNTEIRPERDWEQLVGRAVSEKKEER